MGIDFEGMKDKVSGEHVDKAADFAKSRFGEHSDKIDSAADKAKGFLGDSGGEQQNEEQQQGGGFGNDAPGAQAGSQYGGDEGQRAEFGGNSGEEGGYGR
ncbi:antitoxin [Amycolatopsis sp. WAC 01376]|uniref:antitoxin n=1 Tax=Amycolatopsis sp. WAC 01376 TaxID=2203195 RepID=UPI001F29EA7B|nr:antitoxin [Amycolatopsis sp. WAC 01376]